MAALTPEARNDLLNRAVRLESRSFLEYIAQTAPPVDIAKYPFVAKHFAEIAHEEDLVVDELVGFIEEQGGHAAALGSYDLTYTSYNYITTDYALRVIQEKLGQNLARFDEILAAAKGDALEPRLAAIRAKKAFQLARVEEMRARLKKAPPPAAATAPAPAAHS